MRGLSVVLAGVLLCGGLVTADEPVVKAPGDAEAFDRVKALAGVWDGTAGAGEQSFPASIRYEVVSNGTAVLERMFAGTPHEMLNMYYLDKGSLVAVHYCAAGNQPRFKYDAAASKASELAFDFAGGDNVDPAKDQHVHAGKLFLGDGAKLEEEWTFWKAGKRDHSARFTLVRKK